MGLNSVTEHRNRPEGVGTAMSAGRILLAVRNPQRADALREALLRTPDIQLAGIVDPRIDRALDGWSPYADILLIGADELLWLQRSRTGDPLPASSTMRVVVLRAQSSTPHFLNPTNAPLHLP